MMVSVPCRCRLPEIAWVSRSRRRLPQPERPGWVFRVCVAVQGVCGRSPYAGAALGVTESAGPHAEQGGVPTPQPEPSGAAGRPPLVGVSPTPCVRARGMVYPLKDTITGG